MFLYENKKKIALFIDGENIQPESLKQVFEEASTWGDIIISNLYINLLTPKKSSWIPFVENHNLTVKNRDSMAAGKNTVDIQITIDIMDYITKHQLHIIGIASGDSDFIPLIKRVKCEGIKIIGFGDKHKSNQKLASQFDYFINLEPSLDLPVNISNGKPIDVNGIKKTLLEYQHQVGRIELSKIKAALSPNYPDFKSKTYGSASMRKLFDRLPSHFSVIEDRGTLYLKIL